MAQTLRRRPGMDPILEQIDQPPQIEEPSPPPLPPKTLNNDSSLDLGRESISREDLRLPPVPGEYLNWEQWESYALTLNKNHWSHMDCYLYRYFPIIDREPKYIDCLGEWKDFNYYISTHGGGDYGLVVSDRGLPKRSQKICSVKFTVDKQKFDPILNLIELDMKEIKNRAYINKLINQGKLSPDMEIINMQPRGSTDQSELVKDLTDKLVNMATDKASQNGKARETGIENQAASRAIDMVSDVSKKLMDQQINNNDPLKLLDVVTRLVGSNKPNDSSLDLMKFMMERSDKIIQIMMDSIKSTNERIEKLIEKIGEKKEANGTGGANLDSLNTMLEIAERLGGGKTSSTLETILSTVKEVIPHFAGPLMQGIMSRQPYPIQTPGSPSQSLPSLPSPNDSGVIAMPSPNPSNDPSTPVATGVVTVNEIAQAISQFGPRILQAIERGDQGSDLAQSLEMLTGYETYLRVKALLEDRSLVMEAAKRVPQFYMVIKGHGLDKFEGFLDSFCEWSTLRESPEGEEGNLS